MAQVVPRSMTKISAEVWTDEPAKYHCEVDFHTTLDKCPQGDSPPVLSILHFLSPCRCEPSISVQRWDPMIHVHPAYRMWCNSPEGRQCLPEGAPSPRKSFASWTKQIPRNFYIKMVKSTFKAQYGEVIILQSINQSTQRSPLGKFFKSRGLCWSFNVADRCPKVQLGIQA